MSITCSASRELVRLQKVTMCEVLERNMVFIMQRQYSGNILWRMVAVCGEPFFLHLIITCN